MKKLLTTSLAFSIIMIGFGQAKITSNGKVVTSVDHGIKDLKVEVPLDANAKKYERLAIVVNVSSESGFAGTQQLVLNGGGVTRTLRDQSAQGTYYRDFEDNWSSVSKLSGSIVKSDGTSSFNSWLPRIDGLTGGMDNHDLKMNEIDSHPLRVDQKYIITFELWGANSERKWDKDEETYYQYYTYKELQKYSEKLTYKFAEGHTEHFANDKSYSVAKIIDDTFGNPNCQSLRFDKEASPITKVNSQQNYFKDGQEKGGVEIINWRIYDNGKDYYFNYDFMSFPATTMSFEDTKQDLYNYLYVLASPKSSSGSGFAGGKLLGKGIGAIKGKLNKDKTEDNPDTSKEKTKVERGPANVYWHKYVDCYYVIPGLCENLEKGKEANDQIVSKYPEVPVWESIQIAGLDEAFILKAENVIQYSKGFSFDFNTKTNYFRDDCEKELHQLQIFVGKKGDKVYVGCFVANKKDTSTDSKNAQMAEGLLKSFKAF